MKYVIKKKIPKYAAAGPVGGISGLGVEPMVSSQTPAPWNPYKFYTPEQMLTMTDGAFENSDVSYNSGFVSSIDSLVGDMTQKNLDFTNPPVVTGNTQTKEESVKEDVLLEEEKTPKDEETNIYDFTTLPYYGASDIGSRAMQMGRGIGRMTSEGYGDLSGGAKTANTIGTVASIIGTGFGLAREIYSGISAGKGEIKNQQLAAERLAKQRRRSMLRYEKDGGTYLGPGGNFDMGSITGEYLYPLPKSMEDNANVEVEKGEYVVQPGDTPKEALGNKHSDGGTPVDLETGTKVITDDTTIKADFAKFIRDTYKIKATPKDTYATLMDRYKSKIGLKSAYEDQEKALKRVEKNDKITDDNTRRLNESVLAKAVSDAEEVIGGLEGRFTDFANVIYKEQERQKGLEDEATYFAKGGTVDKRFSELKKLHGFTDEDIADIKKRMLEKIADARHKMDIGGTAIFGRKLRFAPVANKYNNANNTFGYQRFDGKAGDEDFYGGANVVDRNWLDVYKEINPALAEAYMNSGEGVGAKAIQELYKKQTDSGINLSVLDNPMIANAEEMRNYLTTVSFGGEDSEGNYPQDKNATYHDRAMDNKLGLFTTSRPMYSLDVVSEEQKKALNEAGITHFSQLFSDENKDNVAKILGDDFMKMESLRSMNGMGGLDFMLEAYRPDPGDPLSPGRPKPKRPDLDTKIYNPPTPVTPAPVTPAPVTPAPEKPAPEEPAAKVKVKKEKAEKQNVVGAGLAFPEVFRMGPSPVITEGIERHYAPRIDPALRSAEQYIAEASRTFNAQLDQLDSVPDSQRGALASNFQAIMNSNVGKFINEVETANVAQRVAADNFNAQSWANTEDKNIAERLRYQTGMLKGLAINEENWNRYFDSVNDEIQQKWNTVTTMNTLRSMFPDMEVGPNGQLVYRPSQPILAPRRNYEAIMMENAYKNSKTKSK